LDIKIFPNPAKGKLYITDAQNRKLSYQIYNLMGQNELYGALENPGHPNNAIDISGLLNGMHILKIVSDKGSECIKIMVAN